MYILLLLDLYPNHIDHQDQTIASHTWVLRVELLEFDRESGCCQGYRSKEKDRHASRKFGCRSEL